MVLAFATGADGKGALKLWPLFGVVNQILATISLLIISLYLRAKGGWKWLISGVPAVFMIVNILWATFGNQKIFDRQNNTLLTFVNGLILFIAVWIIIEGVLSFRKKPKQTKAKSS
jgi:carbon starvation protein